LTRPTPFGGTIFHYIVVSIVAGSKHPLPPVGGYIPPFGGVLARVVDRAVVDIEDEWDGSIAWDMSDANQHCRTAYTTSVWGQVSVDPT
jgi:hypothetical protein